MPAHRRPNASFTPAEHKFESRRKVISTEGVVNCLVERVEESDEQDIANVACKHADRIVLFVSNPGFSGVAGQIDTVIQVIRQEQ